MPRHFDRKMAKKSTSAPKSVAKAKGGKPVYVLNGPNLNLLGLREPEIYGRTSLADIEKLVTAHAKARGATVLCLQSNHEGELVTWIQEARSMASGLIINAAAYSHTSIAIHDALAMLDIPAVEVHISNVHKREEFRHYSYMSSVVKGVICGLGVQGYTLALDAILADISK